MSIDTEIDDSSKVTTKCRVQALCSVCIVTFEWYYGNGEICGVMGLGTEIADEEPAPETKNPPTGYGVLVFSRLHA